MRGARFFFFFNDTATTEIYTLSLHDALPIYRRAVDEGNQGQRSAGRAPGAFPQPDHQSCGGVVRCAGDRRQDRSEEHTSELQSLAYIVCRLLLEKKKKMK